MTTVRLHYTCLSSIGLSPSMTLHFDFDFGFDFGFDFSFDFDFDFGFRSPLFGCQLSFHSKTVCSLAPPVAIVPFPIRHRHVSRNHFFSLAPSLPHTTAIMPFFSNSLSCSSIFYSHHVQIHPSYSSLRLTHIL